MRELDGLVLFDGIIEHLGKKRKAFVSRDADCYICSECTTDICKKYHLPCSNCDDKESFDIKSKWLGRKCTHCNGNGKVDNYIEYIFFDCTYCGGKGYIGK